MQCHAEVGTGGGDDWVGVAVVSVVLMEVLKGSFDDCCGGSLDALTLQ